jgi:cytochrome c553
MPAAKYSLLVDQTMSIRTVIIAWVAATSGVATLAAASTPAERAAQEKFFEERIRPLLAARCWKCHGPEKQESDLRLDTAAGVHGKGVAGQPITAPGRPQDSLLLAAVRYDGSLKMPPDQKLPAAEIEALEQWIAMGVPWPATSSAPAARLGAMERAAVDRRSHWAYQPIARPPIPSPNAELARLRSRLSTPLDALIAAPLQAAGLDFSRVADRRTLARRLALDLLGVPLDADTVDAFVADESPDATARLVDRLLASPRYGERWGRHWLDVARYADTKGYAFAQERRYPYAYTYRDYVINAFNRDVPYDRFVLEQLAADQLGPDTSTESLAALGFLTTGRKFNNVHDDIDDKIDVVGRGLLGLTISCARCHDHKFDAIPADDYYSLYGVFASCHEPGELPMIGPPSQNAAYQTFAAELAKLNGELDAFRARKRTEHTELARRHTTDYLARQLADRPNVVLEKLSFLVGKPDDLRPKLVERWRDYLKSKSRSADPVFGVWFELAAVDEGKPEAGKPEAGKPEAGKPMASDFVSLSRPVIDRLLARPEGLQEGQINPRVKAALAARPPLTRAEIARFYGELFQDALQAWLAAGGNSDAEGKLPADLRQLAQPLIAKDGPVDLAGSDLKGVLNRAEGNQERELRKKIDAFQANSPAAPPRAMVVADNAQPHNPRVFIRGNPARPGKEVPRQFLLVAATAERQPFRRGSGRLELAESIVAPSNPLTRRVLVNRLWMNHFGEPLVATPSDFGIRAEVPPQHAALDYLAATLLERDWSQKAIHRELVLSTVYRQSSVDRPDARAVDPENRLYWRMNRRRLEFESLRDSLLALSGELDASLYGRPVEITRPPFSNRRSVYGYIDRQDLPNLLRVFDFASPDQSSERRPRTTVPQQALFLMNSPFVLDRAKALEPIALAASAGGAPAGGAPAGGAPAGGAPSGGVTGGNAGGVDALYRQLFARLPSDSERRLGLAFLASASEPSAEAKLSAWTLYAQLLLLTNEVAFID